MDIDPRTHDLTGPRPPVEIQITIELPRFTLEDNAFAGMVGGHVTVKHQPTGQQVDAVCQSVTYHQATHTITLRLQLPAHDLPHQDWQLAHEPTMSIEPVQPNNTRIDLTPYIREAHIDQRAYRIRPQL